MRPKIPFPGAAAPSARDLVAVDGAAFAPFGESNGAARQTEEPESLGSLRSAIARLDARGEMLRSLAESGDDALRDWIHLDSNERGFLYAEGEYRKRGGVVSEDFSSSPRGFDDDKTSARDADVRAAASCSRRAVSPSTPPATPRTRAAPRSAATWSWSRTEHQLHQRVRFIVRVLAFSRASKTTPPATRCAAPMLARPRGVRRRVAEAWARGATEVCMQGGIHPEFTGETYLSLLRAAKRARVACAFSPLEVRHGAETFAGGAARGRLCVLGLLKSEALGRSGTAAEILSGRSARGACPDKLDARAVAAAEAAHAAACLRRRR